MPNDSTPQSTNEQGYIVDERRSHFFQIDNVVLDTYLPVIGHSAYVVYSYLVRVAGNKNVAFPGIKKVAEKCGMGESTVKRQMAILAGKPVKVGGDDSVSLLKRAHLAPLIRIVPRKRDSDGGQTSNNYVICNLTGEIPPAHQWTPPSPPVDPQEEDTEKKNRPVGTGSSAPNQTAKRASRVDPNFEIDDDLMNWCFQEGFTREQALDQVPQFIDNHAARGTMMKDWRAAFRTWMRNARKWDRLGPSTPALARRQHNPSYYKPNGGLTAEGMAAKVRGEIA